MIPFMKTNGRKTGSKHLRFLVVEDDRLTCMAIGRLLDSFGSVLFAKTASEGRLMMNNSAVDMAFIDLGLEKAMAGIELIDTAVKKDIYPVVLSGNEDAYSIEEAYKRGCRDYLVKPLNGTILQSLLQRRQETNFFDLNGLDLNDPPLLITGETGTGKGFLARKIHQRFFHQAPFVELTCAGIPENLLESELFGFEKGAFTGAVSSKPGRLELADGGILFLDEVATMPLSTQKKLLKAIEEKTFYRLGGIRPRKARFFLVSATCEDLHEMVEKGQFRKDLYFRLEGNVIDLLPLRRRKRELASLMDDFLKNGSRRVVLDEEARQVLLNYPWPGNIRELSHAMKILRKSRHGIITLNSLPQKYKDTGRFPRAFKHGDGFMEYACSNGLKKLVEKVEEEAVSHVLEQNGNQIRKTADTLKLSPSTFYKIRGRMDGKK